MNIYYLTPDDYFRVLYTWDNENKIFTMSRNNNVEIIHLDNIENVINIDNKLQEMLVNEITLLHGDILGQDIRLSCIDLSRIELLIIGCLVIDNDLIKIFNHCVVDLRYDTFYIRLTNMVTIKYDSI